MLITYIKNTKTIMQEINADGVNSYTLSGHAFI